jgi:hypothetical protein
MWLPPANPQAFIPAATAALMLIYDIITESINDSVKFVADFAAMILYGNALCSRTKTNLKAVWV